MSPDRNVTLAEMGPLYDGALPMRGDQEFVFAQLLDSISYCERLGSRAWSVTQLATGFRLNVGQVEAMTCGLTFVPSCELGRKGDTTLVTLRLLVAGADCLDKIDSLGDTAGLEEMSYSSVSERHWCYYGTFHSGTNGKPDVKRLVVAEHIESLRKNHHAFLALACLTPTGKTRQVSNFARHHSEALYAYARTVGIRVSGTQPKDPERGQPDIGSVQISPLVHTRIEKAAADCGFELPLQVGADGLVLRSAQFPEFVVVQPLEDGGFDLRASVPMLLPEVVSQSEIFRVQGWSVLYDILGKAAATARTMPDRVAEKFRQVTATLPRATEAERLVVQRVGQDFFRGALLDYWQGRCCVTGLAVPELLRASHIKPWAQCDSDEERLDVFNGLLLAPQLDALFDSGLITFDEVGAMVISNGLPAAAVQLLAVTSDMRIDSMTPSHQAYMAFHRVQVFRV
jgi:putative restriction endonuclease